MSLASQAIALVTKILTQMSIRGQTGIKSIPNAREIQNKAIDIVSEMREKGYDLARDFSPANIKLFLNNKKFRNQEEGIGNFFRKKYPPHKQRNQLGFMSKNYPLGVQPGSTAAKAIDESTLYKAKKFEGLDYDTQSIPADMYKEVFKGETAGISKIQNQMSKVQKASDDLGKTLGKNKSILEDVFDNMFGGFTPKVVPKLSTDQIKKIKKTISSRAKNQSAEENKRYARELMTNNDDFRNLPDADRKELLDSIEELIRDSGDDVFPFNTGGRVGFKNGKGVASLEEEYYGKQKLDWLINFSDQMTFEEYLQMISMKAAKGGRVGLKGGGVGHPPSSNSMFENIFYNPNHPYISTMNTMGILDMIQQIPFFNKGGRVCFKNGKGLTRRTFLKLMGGLAALPVVGKFLGPATKTVEKAAPVIGEGFKIGKDNFLLLVDKIKRFGKKTDGLATKEREVGYVYSDKKGNTYELIEDISSGDKRIIKDRPGVGQYGEETFDTIEDRTVMELKKGEYVKNKKGKIIKTKDEYTENQEVAGVDGTFDDFDEVADDVAEEIIEEVGGAVIKKKSGGLATMFRKKNV